MMIKALSSFSVAFCDIGGVLRKKMTPGKLCVCVCVCVFMHMHCVCVCACICMHVVCEYVKIFAVKLESMTSFVPFHFFSVSL